MDKKIFRRVGILIAVSLAALTLLQAAWLVRMYNDMNRNFSRQVTSALEKAAYDELIYRESSTAEIQASMNRTQKLSDDSLTRVIIDSITFKSLSGSISSINSGDLGIKDIDSATMIRADSSEVVITVNDKSSGTPVSNVMVFSLPARSRMPTVGNVIKCDSLFSENLSVAGIDLPYRFSLVENDTQQEIVFLREEVPNALRFVLPADSRGLSSYVVTISNPNRGFLREMAGILLSSLLIIVLITFSFVYLLRTLFRQKTLEKMRMDLTHNITHELKTPVAVASAAQEALTGFGAGDDPHKRRKYLNVIGEQLSHLTDMVEKILSISLYEQPQYDLVFTEANLREMVEEQAGMLSLVDRKEARVKVDIPDDLLLRCDKGHLSAVIKNLLDNAVKYSSGKADVTVGAITLEDQVVITVSDKGIGIPKSSQGRIFEKFYRVPTGDRHDVKGFGLGLYYVHDMVRKHGGSITVESREGHGTTFIIKLPHRG